MLNIFFSTKIFFFFYYDVNGDNMKRLKFVPYIVLAIVFGYFFGNVFFSDYKDNSLTAFSEGEKLFFVQLGVYDNFENIKNY